MHMVTRIYLLPIGITESLAQHLRNRVLVIFNLIITLFSCRATQRQHGVVLHKAD